MNKRITAIIIQKHNRQRVNIFLDGDFGFGLNKCALGWLEVGQELSEEKIAELKTKDTLEEAYQQALTILSYRARTETEVHRNLAEHQFPEQVIIEVIERLKANGMVDDHRFALNWIENRNEFHPRSKKALGYELRNHGVSADIIEEMLDQTEIEEQGLAHQVALKFARNLHDLDWNNFRKKLTGYLARRGFDYDTSAKVVKQVWNANYADSSYPKEKNLDEEIEQ